MDSSIHSGQHLAWDHFCGNIAIPEAISSCAVNDAVMPIIARIAEHHKTLVNIVKHHRTLIKHCEKLKHSPFKTLANVDIGNCGVGITLSVCLRSQSLCRCATELLVMEIWVLFPDLTTHRCSYPAMAET